MTDRYNTLTVAIENDIREDDAEAILSAIRQIRGVLSVKGNVADTTAYLAEERARSELGKRLIEIVYPKA